MFKPELIRRVLRFGLVGLVVMLCFMGLNWLMARWLKPDLAFLVSYPPALALHFALNKWWTFGCARTDSGRQVAEYLGMAVVTFLIQAMVFKALTAFTPLAPWLAAGAANVAQMAVSFLIMQQRVFAPLKPKPAP